jgi:hypothetical protein
LAFINMEIAVESWTGIAFANGNKEPAKGRQGGMSNAESCRSAWACGHCSHGCACRRPWCRLVGIPDHRFEIFASAFVRRGLPIAIFKIQREDT